MVCLLLMVGCWKARYQILHKTSVDHHKLYLNILLMSAEILKVGIEKRKIGEASASSEKKRIAKEEAAATTTTTSAASAGNRWMNFLSFIIC